MEVVLPQDITMLCKMSSEGKRHRVSIFNGRDGSRLWLTVRSPQMFHAEVQQFCALGGQQKDDGVFYSRPRTVIKCNFGAVHLSVKTKVGYHNSCWEECHSCERLTRRLIQSSTESLDQVNALVPNQAAPTGLPEPRPASSPLLLPPLRNKFCTPQSTANTTDGPAQHTRGVLLPKSQVNKRRKNK